MDLDWINGQDVELEEEARKCNTKEELRALAKKKGIKLTEDELDKIFYFLHQRELGEDELDLVAGGSKKQEKIQRKETIKAQNKYSPSELTMDGMDPLTEDEANAALTNGEKLFLDPNSNQWYRAF